MIEAFSELGPGAAATADALAPYAPSGVLAAIGFMLRGALAPLVDAAKAAKAYFEALTDHVEAEKAHIEAELAHWDREERLLSQIVASHILTDSPA